MGSETGTRQALERESTIPRSGGEASCAEDSICVSDQDGVGDQDRERVARIQAAIEAGTYEVDALELSRAIVNWHLRVP